MGMILFYCGVALLAATVITALVFRAKRTALQSGAAAINVAVSGLAAGSIQIQARLCSHFIPARTLPGPFSARRQGSPAAR